MATTLSSTYDLNPRNSAETERRYLLADSVAPSESASIITDLGDDGGDRTPRAHSPAPPTAQQAINQRFRIPATTTASTNPLERRETISAPSQQPYRGFPSEAHYLAALHQWAEGQKYVQVADSPLVGFYGHTSLGEYAARPGLELGIKRKWRARREARLAKKEEGKMSVGASGDGDAGRGRRNTVV
ncbi:hypothetical protein LTR62_007802 [Meristemomyces frigidus]|uniref:Uncharacterized protein n=1 Tax=Meristemomyces frigidus TaxID=1508187 RepID=A0AAN7TAE4_9PEZI|nr:hypothetical protein LTR62_007802 [Meristemomyces frigidus]